MNDFLGEPVWAEPPAPTPMIGERLRSAFVAAVVGSPLAVGIVVATRSYGFAFAVVAGMALAGWLWPFPRSGTAFRAAALRWSFLAAATVTLLDVIIREVTVYLGGGWYFPRPEREPLIYLILVGVAALVQTIVYWIPMYILGTVAAAIHARLRPSDGGV